MIISNKILKERVKNNFLKLINSIVHIKQLEKYYKNRKKLLTKSVEFDNIIEH